MRKTERRNGLWILAFVVVAHYGEGFLPSPGKTEIIRMLTLLVRIAAKRTYKKATARTTIERRSGYVDRSFEER